MAEILRDNIHRISYATDASCYRQMPYGVCYPKDKEDVLSLLKTAKENHLDIIPRAGGTSIAGQVVGSGIVCDISKHWNKILEINKEERWVRVQPGVVRDELNLALKPYNLFFSPETSTSNRCCIGGMVGNNSCGTHSLVYGSTRHHLLEAEVILSDGSTELFKDYTIKELEERFGEEFWHNNQEKTTLAQRIYSQLIKWGLDESVSKKIEESFPDKSLKRRSTGYAIDEVIEDIANQNKPLKERTINLCKLLAGSEGTLAFITEVKLSLNPIPPKERMVVCAHCNSLEDSLLANLVALSHSPVAVELMDGQILSLSRTNIEQQRNFFFVNGEPKALIIAEFEGEKMEEYAKEFERDVIENKHLAYCCTRVYGKEIERVWNLRKAGLGVLSGMKGDAKPFGVIEDTAVSPERMPEYIADIKRMLNELNLECVYYGHISTGELHLRPILNLKEPADIKRFREVATLSAQIVKKHRGSLSGEHGDGRLRGEFIPLMYGDEVYDMMRQIKRLWDPDSLFNMGKIVDTPPMDEYLRFITTMAYTLPQKTYFRWNKGFTHNETNPYAFLSNIEQCNGAGVCRRSNLIGGTMCPSFKSSMEETNTTRARANVLRELLTYGTPSQQQNISFKELVKAPEIEEVLNSCLACKGCKSECPSNVDMTRIRAELLQHKWDAEGTPLKIKMIARMALFEKLGRTFRPLYNYFATNSFTERLIKSVVHFAAERHIPTLSRYTMRTLVKREVAKHTQQKSKGKVYLFADEFTNNQEAELGLAFAKLLLKLGYEVEIPHHVESGRAAISKGCLKLAKRYANKNVELLSPIITEETPLVGIEPSCILSFRDEYPDLVDKENEEKAISLAKNALLYDEFIIREIEEGNITAEMFSNDEMEIFLHGHCHQKSLVGIEKTVRVLSTLLQGARVNVIPSSCCGMAGSFGYEKEHYKKSIEIGEMVLFPAVRKAVREHKEKEGSPLFVLAPGTSCRQQILDGTGIKAHHPLEILLKYCTIESF
ncbi:MAG: FAD-binding protein [Bacteroidales bacterium]|nr:FAD-binding protein [Bacteroidales bacterium]